MNSFFSRLFIREDRSTRDLLALIAAHLVTLTEQGNNMARTLKEALAVVTTVKEKADTIAQLVADLRAALAKADLTPEQQAAVEAIFDVATNAGNAIDGALVVPQPV